MLSSRFFRFFRYLNLGTLRKTFARAMKRRLMGLSAEMAYNAMLALFPAILAVLTAIGLFEDSLQETFRDLANQLSQVAPDQAVELIRAFKNEIIRTKSSGLFSLSFVLAIWTSSGALSAAMNALDQIHEIPSQQTRPFWKAKLISLGLTLGSIVLLVTASFLVFISGWLVGMVAEQSGVGILLTLWRLLSWPLALGIVATAFAFIYRFGPSRWTQGTPMMPGAVLAAISWAILSALFRLYVANFGNYNKVYGAVGAVIILLLWLYMTSLVLLLGDQLNVTVGDAIRRAKAASIEAAKTEESAIAKPKTVEDSQS
ncbi:YihY/virulence factor BrkB family protein [Microcoleus sp. FACHB-SPT15]|uniref:YihY/virulence factor BrkB family protein n=1 Tax=Microcoleus sp. FACHB-SPT15 TaxID=2692830 RepID=UPI0017814CF2|nr:YihY/virulence factor BrkB family protein [Microcoleus sp. FACHB-SPT15]MBD1807330.1 YihY/virulence factor BrkB family protein [Microcoleus sp. FACHB-SPT15]